MGQRGCNGGLPTILEVSEHGTPGNWRDMRQFASGRECEILSELRSNTFTRSHRAPLLLAALLLSPISARADAGIPMIGIAYPAILFLIIPVIAVEAAYLRLRLRTGWKNTLGAVAKANAITMLLGFPLAWLILFLLELAIWGVADWTGLLKHFRTVSWKPVSHSARDCDKFTLAGTRHGRDLADLGCIQRSFDPVFFPFRVPRER